MSDRHASIERTPAEMHRGGAFPVTAVSFVVACLTGIEGRTLTDDVTVGTMRVRTYSKDGAADVILREWAHRPEAH